MEFIEQELNKVYAFKLLEVWVEVCKEYDVEYDIEKIKDTWVAKPDNEMEAMLKQFGSGTGNVPAEFWVEKAKADFYERVKNIEL